MGRPGERLPGLHGFLAICWRLWPFVGAGVKLRAWHRLWWNLSSTVLESLRTFARVLTPTMALFGTPAFLSAISMFEPWPKKQLARVELCVVDARAPVWDVVDEAMRVPPHPRRLLLASMSTFAS